MGKRLTKEQRRARNKADKEWSAAVRAIGYCEVCGATQYLQAHHLLPRELYQYRHQRQNGICLCPRCHKYSLTLSAHRNPIAFTLWLQANQPEKYSWLVEKIKEGTAPA